VSKCSRTDKTVQQASGFMTSLPSSSLVLRPQGPEAEAGGAGQAPSARDSLPLNRYRANRRAGPFPVVWRKCSRW
jgi:hypothetical protein